MGSVGPRDPAGSSSRPIAFCPDLGQPVHLWRGPDRKGQVSWKAPVGLIPFHLKVAPPQRMNTCSWACWAS